MLVKMNNGINSKTRTKEMFERVVNNLQTIVEKGEYEEFLKFHRKLKNNYSFNNMILVYSQFPDATRLAGRKKWFDLGRNVIRGEKGIAIIAPIPRKMTRIEKVVEDGEEKEKQVSYDYNWYRYVYIYDISQTEGKEIPLETQKLNSNDMGYFYEKLKKFSQVPVYEEELYGGTQGYYSKNKNKIAIKKNLSEDDKAATLLHELTHSLYDDFDYSKDRNLSEVFVESVAFIVADHFGLDTSKCSFNYIAKWASGEPKTVIDLGNKIQKCANEFIEKLEQFEAQELEKTA